MTDLENELKISKNELKELIYFNKMYFTVLDLMILMLIQWLVIIV